MAQLPLKNRIIKYLVCKGWIPVLRADVARERRVCAVCRQKNPGPLRWGDPFVYQYGKEHSHKSCIDAATEGEVER